MAWARKCGPRDVLPLLLLRARVGAARDAVGLHLWGAHMEVHRKWQRGQGSSVSGGRQRRYCHAEMWSCEGRNKTTPTLVNPRARIVFGPRVPAIPRHPAAPTVARRDVCLSCVWDSTAVPPGRTLRARELYGTRLYYGDIGARFAYGIYVCFLAGYRCGRTRAPAAAGVLGNEGELSEARQRLQHQRHAPPSADLQMPSCARHSAPSGGRLQHV